MKRGPALQLSSSDDAPFAREEKRIIFFNPWSVTEKMSHHNSVLRPPRWVPSPIIAAPRRSKY
jgi:hypothetical protein